jgi:hypothetical protein
MILIFLLNLYAKDGRMLWKYHKRITLRNKSMHEGVVVCFFSKNIIYSQCCSKKYSDFGGREKKSDSEYLSYKLMLNSEKKMALCGTKKINILTLVLSKKKF